MPGRSERGGEILGHQGDVRAARARRGQRIGRRGAASAAPLPVEELGRCARPGVLGWLPHRLPEPARLGPVQWDHGVESARVHGEDGHRRCCGPQGRRLLAGNEAAALAGRRPAR